MQVGTAKGGFADGLVLVSRFDGGVLVVHKPANECQLYEWKEGVFVPAWRRRRAVDWELVVETADGPERDVMAHPGVPTDAEIRATAPPLPAARATAAPVGGPLRWAQQRIIDSYASAVNSGTVPDQAHLDRGGYHVSVDDLIRYGNGGDYSNSRPGDRTSELTVFGRTQGAASDIGMSTADMALNYRRIAAVHANRANDPRAKFLNYVNTYKGSGDATRFDFVDGSVGFATEDHKWHVHEDRKRIHVDTQRNEAECWTAARAVVSVHTGQSLADWHAGEEAEMGIQCSWIDYAAGKPDTNEKENVVRLQSKLQYLGKLPNTAEARDGKYGNMTRDALHAVIPGASGNYHGGWTDATLDVLLARKEAQAAAKAAVTAALATDAEVAAAIASAINAHKAEPHGGEVGPHTHPLSITGSVGEPA